MSALNISGCWKSALILDHKELILLTENRLQLIWEYLDILYARFFFNVVISEGGTRIFTAKVS